MKKIFIAKIIFLTFIVSKTSISGDTAEAQATCFVAPDGVEARVRGGYNRVIPIDQETTLNGRPSVDLNVDPDLTHDLSYRWACTIMSMEGFGESCINIFKGYTSGKTLTINKITINNMVENTDYMVTLSVFGTGGRQHTVGVSVSGAPLGAPTVTALGPSSKVNVNDRVILSGSLTAFNDQNTSWF